MSLSSHTCLHFKGRSGGAIVLDEFPVPGRPTNLYDSRGRAYYACGRCGLGLFVHLISCLSSLSFLSLSLGDGPKIKYFLRELLNTKQPINQPAFQFVS